ncbi:MAG: FHA domain-containing protein [Bdellovibrionota bacterium]
MATDSTELTFVRCPACRSLVPAMSSRCRMCGAGLDPVDEAQQAKDDDSVRERKKTVVYTPGSDLSSADEMTSQKKELAEDPLGDFVDEVPVDQQSQEADPISEPDPLGEVVEQAEVSFEPEAKVRVEQGRGKRGGLSFSKPQEKRIEEVESLDEDPLANLYQNEDLVPEPIQAPVQKLAQDQVSFQPEVQVVAQPAKVSQVAKGLVGWLVSASGDELLVELRAGKRFVTGTQLKESDLVLKHASVSTPHAMLLVTDDGSCLVQDVMSEAGVFIRSSAMDEFRQTEERVTLEHGNRVAFGDLEFIVVLIPK